MSNKTTKLHKLSDDTLIKLAAAATGSNATSSKAKSVKPKEYPPSRWEGIRSSITAYKDAETKKQDQSAKDAVKAKEQAEKERIANMSNTERASENWTSNWQNFKQFGKQNLNGNSSNG